MLQSNTSCQCCRQCIMVAVAKWVELEPFIMNCSWFSNTVGSVPCIA